MSPLDLVLAGVGLIAAGALVALVLHRVARAAIVAVGGAVSGGALGLWGAFAALRDGWAGELTASWQVPGGAFVIGLDPLSAFFLVPVFLLGALCAVYGHAYLGARPVAAAKLNALLAAMALVLVARHGLVFLVAWETMTLLAYLLVVHDDEQAEVRRAGWVYLVASHVAMAALMALFLLLGARAGGELTFAAFAAARQPTVAGGAGLLALALLGFGIKAGAVGLHGWLPEAHAAAPSHVSALMSGALIKLGVYGVLRTALLVPTGAGFGVVLMILGAGGAVLGIALALYQRDLKRILAYSSVENIGVILLAMGLGFWARAHGEGALAALAFAAGLLHVWNHAVMKGLMFLGAGSVVHGAGTQDVERLGGLLGRMPWTGRALIVGALALAALPPLCGFTGEWLLFRALAHVGLHGAAAPGLAAIGGAAALALVGGLAALCFVRLVGVVLLGTPRGEGAARAHESPPGMTVPMWILVAACAGFAVAAPTLVATQASVVARLGAVAPTAVAAAAASLTPLVLASAGLVAATALLLGLLARGVRRAAVAETWGCGYAAPTARMQYTAHAFSALFVARALPRSLRARVHARAPEGTFPATATFATKIQDPLTRGLFEPLITRVGDLFSGLRILQQGNVHLYLVYIVATAIVALAWVVVRDGVAW